MIQNGLEKLAMFPVRMDITMATAAGASVILVTTARDAVKYVLAREPVLIGTDIFVDYLHKKTRVSDLGNFSNTLYHNSFSCVVCFCM